MERNSKQREDKRTGHTPIRNIKKPASKPRYTFDYAFDLFYQSKSFERLREKIALARSQMSRWNYYWNSPIETLKPGCKITF